MLLWVAAIISNVGTWMQIVARAWVIYTQTGDDPLWLGYLGASVAVPMVLLPPFAGRVIDRVDRGRLLAVTQSIGALCALVLAFLSLRGWLQPTHIIAASVIASSALAFDNPARHTLVADLVPAGVLGSAVALNSAAFTGTAMIGPAVAGVILHTHGAAACFLINAVSYGAVLGVLPAVSVARAPRSKTMTEGGLGTLLADRRIRALLLVAAIAAIGARAHPQILPVFARVVFRAGARTYGALLAAGGAGALLAAVYWSLLRDVDRHVRARRVLFSIVVLAGSIAGVAVSRSLVPTLILLTIAGAASTTLTTVIATDLQLEAPPHLRGRVLSLHTVTLIGLPSVGAMLLAAIADRVSPMASMLFAGVSVLVGAVVITATRPRVATQSVVSE
jgi:MFS family permease